MKQNFFFILFLFLCFFLVGCGKQEKKTQKTSKLSAEKKKTVKKAEPKPEEEVLSAENFSKAFSKPKYRNKQISKEKLPQEEKLPYKINAIGKSPFNNADFQNASTPSDSIAGKLWGRNNYSWLPKWHFVGKGEVYLPDAVISEDLSLLAILENVQRGHNKNQGTMIVFINTFNWSILKIHYFKDKLLTKILFIPDTREVLVWEESQLEIKHRKIHRISINSGEINNSTREISDPLSSMAISPSGNKLFLKTKNQTKTFYVFNTEELHKKPSKKKCNQDDGYIAVYKKNLVFIDKEKLTWYRIKSHQKTNEVPNPSGNIPDNAVFLGTEDKIAFSTYLKHCIVTVNKQSKTISKMSGRVMLFRKDIDTLACEEFKNRQVNFFQVKNLNLTTTLIPAKVKPKTQAGALLLSYLPHHERYMILDTHGTLCLYHKPGKKWKKQIIFSANKENQN